MSALSPGLYRATVCGTPDTIVTVKPGVYATTYSVGRYNEDQHRDITDAKPLIVLDPSKFDTQLVCRVLRGDSIYGVSYLADQIEAQTKPARIPEPGLWGVVEASTDQWKQRHEYVRVRTDGYGDWTFSGGSVNWVGLIDPTLIREGVES